MLRNTRSWKRKSKCSLISKKKLVRKLQRSLFHFLIRAKMTNGNKFKPSEQLKPLILIFGYHDIFIMFHE